MGMDRQRGKHQAGKAAALTGEDQPFVPFRFECVASRGSLAAEYEGGEGCMCCALTLLGVTYDVEWGCHKWGSMHQGYSRSATPCGTASCRLACSVLGCFGCLADW
jgi:hypothetical protein